MPHHSPHFTSLHGTVLNGQSATGKKTNIFNFCRGGAAINCKTFTRTLLDADVAAAPELLRIPLPSPASCALLDVHPVRFVGRTLTVP